jgi:tetratricopeptide (TPR) repeat protein
MTRAYGNRGWPGLGLGPALFLLVCLCFVGILRNEFVWDDWMLVVRTLGFRGWDLRHLRWMLTTVTMSNHTPLAWLSYALDYSIWRLDPFGYNLTNLILHAANAVLFYGFASLLLRRVFPEEGRSAVTAGAFLAAVFFALHPLRVESVAWVSERRDLLAGMFFLATLHFYVQAQTPGSGPRRRLMAASIAAFVLAVLSKPSVVPLPVVLLIMDFYPLRRLRTPLRRAEVLGLLAEKAPFFLIASADAVMAIRAQAITGNFVAVAQYGLASRLAQSLYGLGFYLSKTLVPTGMCALYPLPERLSLLDPMVWRSLFVVAAAAWALRWFAVSGRAAAALWAYYLTMLLPVLGLLQNGPQLVALRYSYLACLGWALLAGVAAVQALSVWRRSRSVSRHAWAAAAAGLVVLVNAGLVQAQIRLCRDDAALWAGVLARYPSSFDANLNMADALIRRNEPGAAITYARTALRLSRGDEGLAALCLAKALAAQGLLPEARMRLDRLIAAHPDWSAAQELLGVVLAGQGELGPALERFRRAAALDPRSAQARYNAGALLAQQGRFSAALPWLEAAARLEPDEPRYRGVREQIRRDLQGRPRPVR